MSTSHDFQPFDPGRGQPRSFWRRLSRPALIGIVAAILGAALLSSLAISNDSAASSASTAASKQTIGSVATAPRLPEGFSETFEDRFVEANGIRQHVVIGGEGPPLLLVHGWPENWYAWRFVMPALAEDFTVIAVDQRGIGLTEQAVDGYDAGTLAADLAALMTELGHERFAVVGHDTGYIISYALAADYPDRVERLVVAEIPGPPGVGKPEDAPKLFVPEPLNEKLWHIPFNRVNDELIIDMVRSNARGFYEYEFAIQGGGATLPKYAINYYIDLYTQNKDALRATFGLYRAWDATVAQNGDRQNTKLEMPVLGVGGANSWGPYAADGIRPAASNVESLVIDGSGHWVAEQAPAELLQALDAFLAPYLEASS